MKWFRSKKIKRFIHSYIHRILPIIILCGWAAVQLRFYRFIPFRLPGLITTPKISKLMETSQKNEFCPAISQSKVIHRYQHLAHDFNDKTYFIAVNLHDSSQILPNMILQLSDVIRFLGPHKVHIAIYENGSRDNTKAILHAFSDYLKANDISHSFELDLSFKNLTGVHRIDYMAMLRNRVLIDFYEPSRTPLMQRLKKTSPKFDELIFLNDVIFCAVDVLELILQKVYQGADMVTGIDFDVYLGKLGFYDLWVARDIEGRVFNKSPRNLIPHSLSNLRWQNSLPFEVYCSWNGATVISGDPFYEQFDPLRFRRANTRVIPQSIDDELMKPPYVSSQIPHYATCGASEISVFCRDLHDLGYHKIAIVPTVKVSYQFDWYQTLKETFSTDFDRMLSPLPDDSKILWRSGSENSLTTWVRCIPMHKNGLRMPDGVPGEEYTGCRSKDFDLLDDL